MEIAIKITGWLATGFSIIYLIPQLIKIIKRKSAKDISIVTTILMVYTGLSWAIYGFIKNDPYVYVTNIVCCLFAVSILTYKVIWMHKNKATIKIIKDARKELKNLTQQELEEKIRVLEIEVTQ